MLSDLLAGVRRMIAAVTGLALKVVGWWRRRAWPAHVDRVAQDPSYAAAVGAVLAGMLGLLKAPEVMAAVLAAAISLLLRSRPDNVGPPEGSVDPEWLV